MRVWLAGSRSFGKAVFELLRSRSNITIVGVTATEDDALWKAAQAAEHMVCHEVYDHWIERYDIDLIVCAQNYKFISARARRASTYGAIGYHPSLLPRHRGRRAVEATIESGDAIAGGTLYQLDDGWDTGPILSQDFCHVVPGWTASDLWRLELFPMGLRLLADLLIDPPGYWHGRSQDERVATTC